MNIGNFFKAIGSLFTSDKGKKIQKQIADAVKFALPIVQTIAVMVPNRTTAEISAAYSQYLVPMSAVLDTGDPKLKAMALRDLAVTLLGRKYPAATQTLNAAVELALAASRAAEK